MRMYDVKAGYCALAQRMRSQRFIKAGEVNAYQRRRSQRL